MKLRYKNRANKQPKSEFVQNIENEKKKYCQNLIQTSQKQEQSDISNKRNWTKQQYKCFLQYFVDVMNENLYISYSFDAPLKRNYHFKHLSQLIYKRLGNQHFLSSDQCKSKFTTIKRRINRQKQRHKKKADYTFVDFIFDQCKQQQIGSQLKQKLELLHQKQSQKSPYMKMTEELIKMEQDKQNEEMNSRIFAYLNKNNNK